MTSLGIETFEELHRRSIEDVPWFTENILDFLGISFSPTYREVVDLSEGIEWPRWCVGGGLNAASACLGGSADPDRLAVIWEGEEGKAETLTYAQLRAQVERCAGGLEASGIGRGDTVGVHLSLGPEAVVAILALAWIGAIAVPLFTGFGEGAIRTRLQDAGARALFTSDAFPRRGSLVPSKATCDAALESCPDVVRVFVVQRAGIPVPMRPGRDLTWDELLQAAATSGRPEPAPTDAEDPLILLFSSGTTGRPKGILHTHCGFPIKAAQDSDLPPRVVPHPMLVPAPVEGREGRASSGTRATA